MPDAPIPVFDLGRVLLDWDPRYLYRSLFADEAEMEHFLADVLSRAWIDELDRGAPIGPAIERLIRAHPGHDAEIRAFDTRWDETLPRAIEGRGPGRPRAGTPGPGPRSRRRPGSASPAGSSPSARSWLGPPGRSLGQSM